MLERLDIGLAALAVVKFQWGSGQDLILASKTTASKSWLTR